MRGFVIRDRAYRRSQTVKAKKKAKFLMEKIQGWAVMSQDGTKNMDWISPRMIGVQASTHSKPCSCMGCGNPRRHFGELTVQERRYLQ